MIGSVGVTVPAAWYLWQSGPDVSHGTGHGEVHHHDPPEEEKEGGEEDSKEGGEESKSGDSSSEGGDDTPKDTPEPSDDEGGDKEGDAEPGPESVKGKVSNASFHHPYLLLFTPLALHVYNTATSLTF